VRSPGGGGGDRLKVSDDRVDLAALQVMLEGWHARCALADDATDHFVAAARGVLGQAGAIGSRIDRGRQMTDTAGLREHLPAQFLRVVEGIVRLLRESVLSPGGQQKQENRGGARHLRILPTLFFLAILPSRARKRKASSQAAPLDRYALAGELQGEGDRRQRLIALAAAVCRPIIDGR